MQKLKPTVNLEQMQSDSKLHRRHVDRISNFPYSLRQQSQEVLTRLPSDFMTNRQTNSQREIERVRSLSLGQHSQDRVVMHSQAQQIENEVYQVTIFYNRVK